MPAGEPHDYNLRRLRPCSAPMLASPPGAETDRFLVLSVCQWETTIREGPHTSEPFLGDVAPPVSYLLTMS
jgi:hypothetical protein